MKKILAIAALAVTSQAFAADYVSVSVENVQGRKGAQDSTAQYVRAGKSFGDYQLGLQSRTAKFADNTTGQSLETTIANTKFNLAGITPFVGAGHDIKGYNYGLVGATYGVKVGPGFALAGVKTRVGSTEDGARTKQTVSFAQYSLPVAKNVSFDVSASHSAQTIKENALGLGVSIGF
jgi:hypothetical protein